MRGAVWLHLQRLQASRGDWTLLPQKGELLCGSARGPIRHTLREVQQGHVEGPLSRIGSSMPSALRVSPALGGLLGTFHRCGGPVTAHIATRTWWPRSVLDARTPSLGLVDPPVWGPVKDHPGTTPAPTARSGLCIWPASASFSIRSRGTAPMGPEGCEVPGAPELHMGVSLVLCPHPRPCTAVGRERPFSSSELFLCLFSHFTALLR